MRNPSRDGHQMDLTGKHVTMVGLGKSGEAATLLLVKKGAHVTVVDDDAKPIPNGLIPFGDQVTFQLGSWDPSRLLLQDLVVISPGVPLPRLPLAELNNRGIPVIGEMELASRFLTAPIIAITGTNGKSTTATLVAEILKASSFQVFLGGNIGTPLSQAVGGSFDFIVVEVSSFQLETIQTFRPRIAALLNVTEDHLNRHGSLERYGMIKRRIFENQTKTDYAVFNAGDPLSLPHATSCGIPISFHSSSLSGQAAVYPERSLFLQGDAVFSNLSGEPQALIKTSRLQLSGRHNLENVMAAMAMAQLAGAPPHAIADGVSAFRGLPHRMENVAEKKGVYYINDSKGTNVGAVVKSLEGIAPPVILIAGGLDKGADFTPIRSRLKNVRGLILIGQAADKLARCFHDHAQILRAHSMKEAVVCAASIAEAGDVVLLSPGCASFDMFRDFEHRGDCFKQAVSEL